MLYNIYIYTYYVSHIYIYDTTPRQPPAPARTEIPPQDFENTAGRKVKNLESEHPMTLSFGESWCGWEEWGLLDFNPIGSMYHG